MPLANATREQDEIRVAYDKNRLKDAPSLEPGRELSRDEEARLYQYYGLDYPEPRPDTGPTYGRASGEPPEPPTPDNADVDARSAGGTDDAMTRSEEEVRVDTERRPRERVRLKKYVITEHKTITIPVQREQIRLEREPHRGDSVDPEGGGRHA